MRRSPGAILVPYRRFAASTSAARINARPASCSNAAGNMAGAAGRQ
ncbi:MAG TPA: hypothetical protein PKK06_02155 [Phycisphaerae bacterium]|nr:hypothetical protein [Phycisphaerae bacterium]HNU44072.1 hypothetical protein [Phycisphaerae bacterium]